MLVALYFVSLQDFHFLLLVVLCLSLFSLCSFQGAVSRISTSTELISDQKKVGGLKWTRTTDLALIRRTL